jgi:hypothetical protein
MYSKVEFPNPKTPVCNINGVPLDIRLGVRGHRTFNTSFKDFCSGEPELEVKLTRIAPVFLFYCKRSEFNLRTLERTKVAKLITQLLDKLISKY